MKVVNKEHKLKSSFEVKIVLVVLMVFSWYAKMVSQSTLNGQDEPVGELTNGFTRWRDARTMSEPVNPANLRGARNNYE